ncbi:MAG: hypothetical protein ACREAE_04675 [Nitrosopumilaceae archaeon]
MKQIFFSAFVYIFFLFSSDCFSQNNLTIQAVDENQQPLRGVEVIIIGITNLAPQQTDNAGYVVIDLDSHGIRIGQEISIVGTLSGYTMKDAPQSYVIRDPIISPNFTRIMLHKSQCGFMSLNEYIKENDRYAIGLGLGYRKGDHVTLGNIPSDIRTTLPHPDDVKNRSGDILDPNIPDNYLIHENAVRIDLGHRKSIDVHFSLWSVINVMIRTSAIRESEVVENQNLFRKNYIKPGITGEALIFYSVKSKKRQFFDGNSFSLPIYITYPVLYCGKNKGLVFRIVGGTNILLPDKIELVAEQGWDRFAEKEIKEAFGLGKLKELGWFGGINVEGIPAMDYRLGIQFTVVYTDYQENFKVPLSLQLENSVRPSLRVSIIKLLRK